MVCLFKVHVYINNLPADLAAILKDSVLSMMDEFAAITQRQLHQFLQGGIYSLPATPEQTEDEPLQAQQFVWRSLSG